MVRGRGVRDAESNGHHVDEGNRRLGHLPRGEILGDMELKEIHAGFHLGGAEERRVGTPVRVGDHRLDELRLRGEPPQLDAEPGRGAAGHEVKDMGAEFSGHFSVIKV